jgi:hypothetical protein
METFTTMFTTDISAGEQQKKWSLRKKNVAIVERLRFKGEILQQKEL